MRVWGSRRRLLVVIAGALGVTATGGSARAGEVGTQDYCYWKKAQGPLCRSGLAKEYWCEHCNDAGTGWTVTRCEWRVVGTC